MELSQIFQFVSNPKNTSESQNQRLMDMLSFDYIIQSV